MSNTVELPSPEGEQDASDSFIHRRGVAALDRAARRRMVARLFRMGWRYSDIARLLGVCAGTISNDVRRLKSLYAEKALQDIKLWLADALLDIDDVAAEAWTQWEESKGRKRTKTVRKTGGRATLVENTVETLEPDSAYLRVVLDCVKRREDLLGLDKQTAREIRATLILQGGLNVGHYVSISSDELSAIRDVLIERGGTDEQMEVG